MKWFLVLIIIQVEGAGVTLCDYDSKPECEKEKVEMSEKISDLYKKEFMYGRTEFPPYALDCITAEPKKHRPDSDE